MDVLWCKLDVLALIYTARHCHILFRSSNYLLDQTQRVLHGVSMNNTEMVSLGLDPTVWAVYTSFWGLERIVGGPYPINHLKNCLDARFGFVRLLTKICLFRSEGSPKTEWGYISSSPSLCSWLGGDESIRPSWYAISDDSEAFRYLQSRGQKKNLIELFKGVYH
ncbi:hypothetical protein ASPVEDRAFT_746758 [Aspergillus versicolor CBS 583.65]|uniref:Uncharacterized protein n=1 Tax=Aspergillus versicolor CBS 583.65 TaxID=1036611 RepID=A0A1L9PQ53_ASPVE|nr:uncharacterized protein ASPVEDRAFT_746758 [Aspergillus versicolor CBS 583.65]OJJ03664.1 hypothetical protein ASPVEDRAFT_746758 [Aspergillus versicolor CBS 583.65]